MSTLLFIEKERNQRLLHRMVLEDEGHRVFTASSGRQAQKIATERCLDLIVLDPGMPGLDAQNVLRRIAAIAPNIPIIVYSGYDEFRRQMFSHLAAACLVKSSDLTRLIEAIEQALRHRKQLQTGMLVGVRASVEKESGVCIRKPAGFGSPTTERGPPVAHLQVC